MFFFVLHKIIIKGYSATMKTVNCHISVEYIFFSYSSNIECIYFMLFMFGKGKGSEIIAFVNMNLNYTFAYFKLRYTKPKK